MYDLINKENIELAIKLLSIPGGIFALWYGQEQYLKLKGDRTKQDIEAIRVLANEIENAKTSIRVGHSYLIERIYEAVTGHSNLDAAEIAYLLSFPAPTRALRLYRTSRPHLEFCIQPSQEGRQISIKPSLRNETKRKWWKRIWFGGYFVFGVLPITSIASLPLLIDHKYLGDNWQASFALAGAFTVMSGWIAFFSLVEGGKLSRAETLLAMQEDKLVQLHQTSSEALPRLTQN